LIATTLVSYSSEGASGRLSAANAMADVFEAPSPT
jgi:hypothetical protein